MIRRWMCRLFSMHDTVCILENFKGNYELHRCKHCGLDAAVHWHTREVKLLSYR